MISIKKITTPEEMDQAFSIRSIVFIEEQKVPQEEEIDDLEDLSTHFLALDDERPVGTGRFRIVDNYGKVERICVLAEYRSKGVGKAIMEAIEQYSLSVQIEILKLHAQTQAIPFYEKLGYAIASDEFLDAGIPHRTMKKHV